MLTLVKSVKHEALVRVKKNRGQERIYQAQSERSLTPRWMGIIKHRLQTWVKKTVQGDSIEHLPVTTSALSIRKKVISIFKSSWEVL